MGFREEAQTLAPYLSGLRREFHRHPEVSRQEFWTAERIEEELDAIGIKIDGEKKGVYQVKKNIIKYGTGGFRQEITLGQRIGE